MDYLITSYLFSTYPKLKPGQLTDLRSVLVNNKAFANVAVDRSLHNFLMFDSSGLSEAINNYVKFIKTSPSSRKLIEETKCPKVDTITPLFLLFIFLDFLFFHVS